MRSVFSLRFVAMMLALAFYAANGAQTHLHLSPGKTILAPFCGLSGERVLEIQLEGEAPAETADTCCGACMVPAALPQPGFRMPPPRLPLAGRVDVLPAPVSPRSPLWPGAPPQGPPHAHSA